MTFSPILENEEYHSLFLEGARSVMVIVVRNGHNDTSSNPGLS